MTAYTASTERKSPILPRMKLGDLSVSRLIVGTNPFVGKSHLNAALNGEMKAYFTEEQVYATLRRCEEAGITAVQSRGSRPVMDLIDRFRRAGGKLDWIATSSKNFITFDEELAESLKYRPSALCIHGELSDELWMTGNIGKLPGLLEKLRTAGLPAGICSHFPEVLLWAEEHKLAPDFYMASVYNLLQPDRSHDVVPTGERFERSDVPKMYEAIRAVSAPCIALKILGAGRRCGMQDDVRAAFDEAFASMKKGDGVLVGMWDKNEEQPALDARYAAEAIAKAEAVQ